MKYGKNTFILLLLNNGIMVIFISDSPPKMIEQFEISGFSRVRFTSQIRNKHCETGNNSDK